MGFLENIDRERIHRKKENEKESIYKKLKSSLLPIYIYGGGNLADNILKKLKQYDIMVKGIITDSGEVNFDIPNNMQVFKYREFIQKNKEKSCNLLLGFASAYERKSILEKEIVFNEVFEISNPFDHHKHFDHNFINEHQIELEQVYNLFDDEYSKECFCAFINARIWEDCDYVRKIFRGEIQEFNNEIFHPGKNEIFIDIGSYTGGSIDRFLKSTQGNYAKIIGIEPENKNFMRLKKFCEMNHINAELHQIGCWNKKDRLLFNAADDKCCRLDEKGTLYIEVDALDNIISQNTKVSIINVSLSVGIREILEGATRIIEHNMPRMLIFMGSSKECLYTVPQYFANINAQYKLYLRFIQAMPSRLFLYALPVVSV